MSQLLMVAAGGAVGSVGRWAAGLWLGPYWATLLVNVGGGFAMGLAYELAPASLRPLVMTGFLGGFTTFSAFSLEAALLWENAPWQAALYVLGSVVLSIAALAAGRWAAP